MSGRINSKQVQIYIIARANGCTQATAAAKGGFSMSTGGRIEKGTHQPQRGKPRHWRTRQDPLAEVWESELVPMLEQTPELQPMTLFEYLQSKYPGKYDKSKLRTLQKRVQQWKAVSGPPKEVMFEQQHRPGEMGLSDFTEFKAATITINGQPFDHLLYHYRLAYSGWQYVQVVLGGESFVALAEGLQKALSQCGGAPKHHRTDSLSAAYRNLEPKAADDLTERYQQLCSHYQMLPTRNNRGRSHENGSIESPHGHFKRRLHQALLLRGSNDFENVESYQQLIAQVIAVLNQRSAHKWIEEKLQLQPLPVHRLADYEVVS
ncbi:MAG: IS21 family transposase, partial [Chroococcidiopsidaceae cyanobacterium CP_BM_RX_35]|nr:IS21 family transposase [Chroococcidiopsidaceae cyanobacterium CP_BM_RX_35]